MPYHGIQTKAYTWPYVCVFMYAIIRMHLWTGTHSILQAIDPRVRVPCVHGGLMVYSRGTRGVLAYHLMGYLQRTREVLAAYSRRTRGVRGCVRVPVAAAPTLAPSRAPTTAAPTRGAAPRAGRTPARVTVSASLSMDVHGKTFTDMPTTHPSPASPTGAPTPSTEYHLRTR